MKITYDPEVDVLRILFSNTPIEESDTDKPGVILDYDKDGNVVGLEILNASKRVGNPSSTRSRADELQDDAAQQLAPRFLALLGDGFGGLGISGQIAGKWTSAL